MSDRYQNCMACGIEPECEGEEPTLMQWRTRCRELWEENYDLRADAAAMAPRIQAGDRSRDEVIEECAALADAHHPPELRKGIDPEAMDTIKAERRGELIAAEEIAVRLRRLKTKPLS